MPHNIVTFPQLNNSIIKRLILYCQFLERTSSLALLIYMKQLLFLVHHQYKHDHCCDIKQTNKQYMMEKQSLMPFGSTISSGRSHNAK